MTDRILLVLSDIEMGAGGLADDFPHDDFLAEVIATHGSRLDPDLRVELVLNGDTLDFLRTSVSTGFPAHITAAIAVEKLDRITAAHPGVFAALRRFVASGDRRIHFIVGNHDAELLFPEVQAQLAGSCGGPSRVHFPGFEADFGPVHIEHGSQLDPLFRMATELPFVGEPERQILNLPWGSLALLSLWGLLKQELFALDRIRPRKRLFELLPDVRSLMLRQSWKYWSRDFWRDFSRDPLKHVTWAMIKEVTYRFLTADVDVDVRDRYCEAMAASAARLFIVGHEHRASRNHLGGKTLITSGCFRNEYLLDADSSQLRPADKGAVEVHLSGSRISATRMLRFPAPAPPPGHVPRDVLELAPLVKRYLDGLTPVPDD